VTNFNETPADTGVTQSETLLLYVGRPITDTGLTQTDSFVRFIHRKKTDTGTTVTDQFVVKSFRVISTTGSTITDSTGAAVRPAPDSPFAFLCSRNWETATTPTKWTTAAYNRFTYTTIAD
jgi:hypothetical protein